MAISYEQFSHDPRSAHNVSEALSHALYEELLQGSLWTPSKPEQAPLVLRDANCGLASLALWNYFGGVDSPLELVRVQTKNTPREYDGKPATHVSLREKQGRDRLITDATAGQFYRWAGLTPQRVARGELGDDLYIGGDRLLQYRERQAHELGQVAARHALHLDKTLPLLERAPGDPSDSDALRGASPADVRAAYGEVFNAGNMQPWTPMEGLRMTYNSKHVADHMRDLTK